MAGVLRIRQVDTGRRLCGGSGVTPTKPKGTKACPLRSQGEAGKDSPPSLGGSMALYTPWFQASGLQDCVEVTLYCFVVLLPPWP